MAGSHSYEGKLYTFLKNIIRSIGNIMMNEEDS